MQTPKGIYPQSMVSPSASVLPESLAMGHKFATDAGREDTGAPHTFWETKKRVGLLLAANLVDNHGQSL
jgi:hypothetical protein